MRIRNPRMKDLEQLCLLEENTFSSSDAASRESMERRLKTHRETIWVIKKEGRIVSGINGVITDERDLCDEMYASEDYYDKRGSWLMIFGVSTLPEYQHRGYASKIMKEVLQEAVRCKMEGVVLTCKPEMIPFYKQFGFVDEGVSSSKHGGAVWHQMRILCKNINRDYKSEILDCVITVAVAAILAFVIGRFVILNCTVPTGSMLDTIQLDDDIFGSRITYKISDPKRGDIAIFKFPDDEEQIYIKRIIGLPGDTIVIKEGKIYINGSQEPLKEDYLSEEARQDTRSFGPYEVPEDCYFMMGDNRPWSEDARFWNNKYVKRDKILAKAEVIYYPFKDFKWIGNGAEY